MTRNLRLKTQNSKLGVRLTLLTKFSLISFLLIAALGFALAWGIQAALEKSALAQEAESVADRVSDAIEPNLTASDLSGLLSPDQYARIDALVHESLMSKHIAHVKIWTRDGLLLYSDEKAIAGIRVPADSKRSVALGGEIATEVSSLNGDENFTERGQFSKLLEIYCPLVPYGSSEILGAFEVHYDMTGLQAQLDSMRLLVGSSLGIGFTLLYGLLFTLVRNVSRSLTRHNEENARLYHEARTQLIQREKADTEVTRQLSRVAALRSIDIAIISSIDLRMTLTQILEQVTDQLQVAAADVLLLNTKSCALEFAAGRGFRSGTAHPEGLAWRAARERRTIGITDLREAGEESVHLHKDEGFLAYYAVPLVAKEQIKGVLEIFHTEPLNPDGQWLAFLEALGGQIAIAVDNSTLFDELQRSNIELSLAYDATLEGWSHALDLRDRETEGHTQRVTEMTMRLARSMGIPEPELVQMRRGALLHDIGKMAIPDAILLKPGPLTDEELEIMRLHPVYAYELLSPIPFLRSSLDIPYYHHEKWDGTGYPRGLKGEQIPSAARIFSIVDVWDALRSDRPYRPAWSEESVIEHIRSISGTHFDPCVVDAFMKLQVWTLPSVTTHSYEPVGSGPLREPIAR